jgi:hypothetical protein
LPLDDRASDDLEGAAWRRGADGKPELLTLTSSGALRRFAPDGKGGLTRQGDAYAIGPAPYACDDLRGVNCGKNYEGLCLRRRGATARCAGYAASKTDSALYCVVDDHGKLGIDPVRPPIHLAVEGMKTKHGLLSDCAFGAEGGPAQDVLVVTTNVFGGSTSYVVDEATGALAAIDLVGTTSNEAIAIDKDGSLYEFADDNGETSQAQRFTCSGW